MKGFGKELILDLHNCDEELYIFTRENIKDFFVELCECINMNRAKLTWWDFKGDKEAYDKAPDHLKGISAVQFIETSNITIHTLDVFHNVYLNVFSCKSFDDKIVIDMARKYFGGDVVTSVVVNRL